MGVAKKEAWYNGTPDYSIKEDAEGKSPIIDVVGYSI